MHTKKAITVVAIVTALIAFTIAIAWLSVNPPRAVYLEYNHDNGHTSATYLPTYHDAPDESYDDPSQTYETDPATPGNIQDDTHQNGVPGNNENYPETPPYSYGNTAQPQNGYDDHHHDNIAEPDYTFTQVFTSEPLPEHIIQLITGVTFHETTPFGYDYLAYLTVTHVNFDGESILGRLIVAADIAYEVLDIFREIYEGGFPIHSIKLIDYFGASDYLSMAANNSHAFNFRYIAGTSIVSRHGFGVAIDINPVQNPYIRGETVWPAAGAAYLDRSYIRPGMIVPGDVVYNAFISRGWTWGGHWTLPRDYHHFERRR